MAIKLGIITGILTLILAFMAKIPIYPPENWELIFKIFSLDNTDFYFWGYTIDGIISFSLITGNFPESLISSLLWLVVIFIGISSIMASTSKAKLNNSLNLFKIDILFLILILGVFGIIIFLLIFENISQIFNIIGLGYYLTILILILNIVALKQLKNE